MTRRAELRPAGPASAAACRGRECGLNRRLFTLHHLMMRIGDRLASEIGLTASRWLLLCAAGRTGEPRTIGELSEDAMASVQNTSRMVAAMEVEGLVERFTRPGAGRAVFVRLTARGRRALERTAELAERFEPAFHAGFTPEELERLESDLERLIANLRRFEAELEEPE